MQKAVIFDMDGVILDSERLAHEAWRELAGKDGLPDIDDLYVEAMGHSKDEIAELFRDKYGYDGYPEFSERALRWSREHSPGGIIPLRSGAGELLEYLREAGLRIGLATATESRVVRQELRDAGALDYFDTIVAGDMVRRCKPDPEVYLTACKELEVKPAEAYGVEDGRNGVLALHEAGMKAIMAVDQYQPSPEIVALCEIVLPSLEAVREYFSVIIPESGETPRK